MRINIPLLSQRDPKWASIILGNNTQAKYNIGNFGCLITSLSMYLNTTPNKINETLKQGRDKDNGFANGSGNFIWGKSTLLGLGEQFLSTRYNGPVTQAGIDKIKGLLDNGYPLLCEIDFNPSTTDEEQHFVLLTGYEGDSIYANDPWTGQYVNLDVYGGAKRAIIQFRQYNKQIIETDPDIDLITCKISLADEIRKKNDTYKELEEWKEKAEVAENFRKSLSKKLFNNEEATWQQIYDDVGRAVKEADDNIKAAALSLRLWNAIQERTKTIYTYPEQEKLLLEALQAVPSVVEISSGEFSVLFRIGGIYICTKEQKEVKI